MRWKMVVFDTDFVIWKIQVDTKAVFIFLSVSIYFGFLTVFLTYFLSLLNLFSALLNIPSLLQPILQTILQHQFCTLILQIPNRNLMCWQKKISIFLEFLNLDFKSRKFPSRQKAHNKKSGSIFLYLFSTFCHVEGVHLIKCAEKNFQKFLKKKVDQFFSN